MIPSEPSDINPSLGPWDDCFGESCLRPHTGGVSAGFALQRRRACAVLRPQQSRVSRLQLPDAAYRPFRHLLLSARRSRGAAGGADGRALVRAAVPRARTYLQLTPTDHLVREPPGVFANQCDLGI